MRWSRNCSASWAERFRTSSLLCTYKLYDYYSTIPILSPFLFTPSLYVLILNLQDVSFTCIFYFLYEISIYLYLYIILYFYWRAGASQLNCTTGTIFMFYLYLSIYHGRCHTVNLLRFFISMQLTIFQKSSPVRSDSSRRCVPTAMDTQCPTVATAENEAPLSSS